jgi:hypothetical protein
MRKTHDADLCERIRKLEERVRELEGRPSIVTYPWTVQPWPFTSPPPSYPTWIGDTSGGTWGSGTTTLPDGTQFTLTNGGDA